MHIGQAKGIGIFTVYQLLFAMTLFRDLPGVNYFATINFRDLTFFDRLLLDSETLRTGSRQEIFAMFRLSRTSQKKRIKVGL